MPAAHCAQQTVKFHALHIARLICCLQNWSYVWRLLGCRADTKPINPSSSFTWTRSSRLHPVARGWYSGWMVLRLITRGVQSFCKRCKMPFYPTVSLHTENFKGFGASGGESRGPRCILWSLICLNEPAVFWWATRSSSHLFFVPGWIRKAGSEKEGRRETLTLIKCIKVTMRGMSVWITGCLLSLFNFFFLGGGVSS